MPVNDWLSAAARNAAVERKLKAGDALFRLGDKTAGLCEVVAGRVKLVRVDRSGREIILHVAGPGETIAEASLFSPSYHCDAVAASNATVRVYPKAAVLAAFDNDAKAARAFNAMLARQVMDLRTRLAQRNIRSARERVRNYLALHAGETGAVTLRGTLKEWAAELGLTHEALYRSLADMERDGEIKRAEGKITLRRAHRV